MAVGWNSSTASVRSVTDGGGNTYQRAVGPTAVATIVSPCCARNILGAAAGANTVTVQLRTRGGVPGHKGSGVQPGAGTANPVDVTAGATGSRPDERIGDDDDATTLIFGADMVTGTTSGPGPGPRDGC